VADVDLTAPLVERVATVQGGTGGPQLQPGAALGRYVVVERLGAGTGGTVYAAFDSHLSRKVALKVLRAADEVELSGPLLREAQLIAALDHPNVVTVHDIGQCNGHTFIAMELVAGSDFAAWLRRHPPREGAWKDRLRPWLLAGRGLAAAHAAGVIHGDFKPANVLLGESGRVRVTDFGVARLRETEVSAEDDDGVAPHDKRLWGTPLYMAPELFHGRPPDERSDVYAYCASVYEALYGIPPANGAELAALVRAKQVVPTPLDPKGVPPRVLDVLRSGLRPDRDARVASVAELVDALERTTRSRRGPWIAGGGVIVLGAVAAIAFDAGRAEQRCAGADARLAGVWDAQRRHAVQQAFDGSELLYAETAWRSFSATVDQYAAAWAGAYTEVCELSERGEQSDALLDEKMACLSRRRAGLLALVDGITGGPTSRIAKAGDAADRLASVAACVELEPKKDSSSPPSDVAQEVARIDELLVAAQTGLDLGDADEAVAIATDALARAEAAGFAPLVARARWALGRAMNHHGDYAEAANVLEQAALQAEEAGDDETAAQAGLSLMNTYGIGLEDSRTALSWAPHIEVALKRGHADRRLWSMLHDYRALALEDLGRTEEAAAVLALAIDDWRQIESEFAEAEIADREARLAAMRGDFDTAVGRQREAARRIEEVAGWPHPQAVVAVDTLADYLDRVGAVDESIGAFERALEGARSSLGLEHPMTLSIAANLGAALNSAGRHEEALDHYEYAREGFARTTGIEHPRYIGVVANIAATLGKAGRHAEAREWAERMIGPLEEHYGPEHRVTGYAYATLGASRLRSGDATAAVDALERALAIYVAQNMAPDEIGGMQFELAKALVESGTDRERAHRLARTAQKAFHDAGLTEDVAMVARWLQET
jgi:tetratricopeptide (TPR) repeat protein